MSAPSAAAGGGDVLAVLVRSWLDLAAETMPGDGALNDLLTSRLLDLAGRRVAPSEAELLDVAEEAAQHAVGKGSADAARLLSKRLRRAIYEYLLSLDAVTQSGTGPGRVLTATGSDDALTASAVAAAGRHGGDRPELIWDEPALRVLEGGARASQVALAPDDGADADEGFPVVEAPPAVGRQELAEEEEEDAEEEPEEPIATFFPGSFLAPAPGESPASAPWDEPAELARPLEPEALRVPERFRRDEPAPPAGPIDDLPALPDTALAADEPPAVEPPPSPSPETPPRHAVPEPRTASPLPRAVVVPSYRAWADVLASDEPRRTEPSAAPGAGPAARPEDTSRREVVERPRAVVPTPPPAPPAPRETEPLPFMAAPPPSIAAPPPSIVAPPPVPESASSPVEEPPLVDAPLPSLSGPAPSLAARTFPGPEPAEDPPAWRPAAAVEPSAVESLYPARPDPRPSSVDSRTTAAAPEPLVTPGPRPAAPPADSAPPAVPAWSLRDRSAERDGLPRARATHDAPPPAVQPPPSAGEQDRPRWNVRSSWLGAPAEGAHSEPATASWVAPEPPPPPDASDGAWPIASAPAASPAPAPGPSSAPAVPSADPAPGSWPSMPPSPSWMAGGPAWPSTAQPAPQRTAAAAPPAAEAEDGAPGSGEMEARIRRAAETRSDADAEGPAWSIRRSPRQQALQQRMAQRRRDDVIRAAAEAFDEGAIATRRNGKLPPLDLATLPDEVAELLRRKKAGEAAALVQRAAQEIGGREIADLAIECGDRCGDRKQNRAAINSYLAAWRADPLYELPLWRLAEGCLSDRETELAAGYLERIADLMRVRGDDEGALDVYRKLITIAPERGDIRALIQTVQSIGRFPD